VAKEKKEKTKLSRSEIAKKAVATRRKNDPNWGNKKEKVAKKKKSKKKEVEE